MGGAGGGMRPHLSITEGGDSIPVYSAVLSCSVNSSIIHHTTKRKQGVKGVKVEGRHKIVSDWKVERGNKIR